MAQVPGSRYGIRTATGDDKNGYAARIAAHLLLMGVHRARLLGYGRSKDLVRLLDATAIE
ncbi:hypothetical protein ACFP51_10785 [Streptomyces pratens]|uniref:Transposase n=1 Tax=Streptomyces pratens TaxID=887456 RepID=A0ABW1LW34_9ACTN